MTADCTTVRLAWALGAVAQAQAQAGNHAAAQRLLDEALSVAREIEAGSERIKALQAVAQTLVNGEETGRVIRLVQQSWLQAGTRTYLLALFSMAMGVVPFNPEIAEGFAASFEWVDNFLKS